MAKRTQLPDSFSAERFFLRTEYVLRNDDLSGERAIATERILEFLRTLPDRDLDAAVSLCELASTEPYTPHMEVFACCVPGIIKKNKSEGMRLAQVFATSPVLRMQVAAGEALRDSIAAGSITPEELGLDWTQPE